MVLASRSDFFRVLLERAEGPPDGAPQGMSSPGQHLQLGEAASEGGAAAEEHLALPMVIPVTALF